jgi:zinc protease
VAEKELLAHLYPEGHPLHYSSLGDKETVAGITRDDLVSFHSRCYRPENVILAIVGDIDPAEVAELVRRIFGTWERVGEPARPELPTVASPPEPRLVRAPVPNKTQVDIALGFPGISRRDPGYYQADLMNYVLGRGFMSRLNMSIREDLGLAYYVWSNYWAYWGPGPWVLQLGVNPANVDKAISAALQELEQIQQEAPSEEELQLWKDYVEGTVARRMETFSGIAQNLVLSAFYELGLYHPYEYPGILRAITGEQVQQAARDFLHPEGYVAVIAGPVEEQ